ncbi:hypothetical protein D3C80_1009470 [compost metagenome]
MCSFMGATALSEWSLLDPGREAASGFAVQVHKAERPQEIQPSGPTTGFFGTLRPTARTLTTHKHEYCTYQKQWE